MAHIASDLKKRGKMLRPLRGLEILTVPRSKHQYLSMLVIITFSEAAYRTLKKKKKRPTVDEILRKAKSYFTAASAGECKKLTAEIVWR